MCVTIARWKDADDTDLLFEAFKNNFEVASFIESRLYRNCLSLCFESYTPHKLEAYQGMPSIAINNMQIMSAFLYVEIRNCCNYSCSCYVDRSCFLERIIAYLLLLERHMQHDMLPINMSLLKSDLFQYLILFNKFQNK